MTAPHSPFCLQCVHVVVNPVTGAVALDPSDASFAITNDQTSSTYYAGVVGAQPYATPYACTAATSVATLLAGTDLTAGFASVNLSGTAFAVSGDTCGGAPSCTCSGAGGPVCGPFSASTYTGAGVVQFYPAAQSATLLTDGLCASWLSPALLPLHGTVLNPPVSCGGIPCGVAGSSCMTLPVTRQNATTNQTFWVSARGLLYLPLPVQTTRPFPTITAANAGTAAAPNTVTYSNIWYSHHALLTAWSCVHVVVNSATGAVAVDTAGLDERT